VKERSACRPDSGRTTARPFTHLVATLLMLRSRLLRRLHFFAPVDGRPSSPTVARSLACRRRSRRRRRETLISSPSARSP